jgi:hypothetical protein
VRLEGLGQLKNPVTSSGKVRYRLKFQFAGVAGPLSKINSARAYGKSVLLFHSSALKMMGADSTQIFGTCLPNLKRPHIPEN